MELSIDFISTGLGNTEGVAWPFSPPQSDSETEITMIIHKLDYKLLINNSFFQKVCWMVIWDQ